eukprot:Opistho-2@12473
MKTCDVRLGPYDVRVCETDDARGRGLFAARAFAPGETIMYAKPAAIGIPHAWYRHVCVCCMSFTHRRKLPILCDTCKMVAYCSSVCKEAPVEVARHGAECAALRQLAEFISRAEKQADEDEAREGEDITGFETRLRFLVSLAASMITGVDQASAVLPPVPHADKNAAAYPSVLADAPQPLLDDLLHLAGDPSLFAIECICWGRMHPVVHSCALRVRPPCSIDPAYKREAVPKYAPSAVPLSGFVGRVLDSPASLAAVVCREECNSFGFWDRDGEMYAYGLFPFASYFNHSCVPNAVKLVRGRMVMFRATAPIMAGDEICLSYVQVTDSCDARNSKLLEMYRFECGCERCRGGDGCEADVLFMRSRAHLRSPAALPPTGTDDYSSSDCLRAGHPAGATTGSLAHANAVGCGGVVYSSTTDGHVGKFCSVCGDVGESSLQNCESLK